MFGRERNWVYRSATPTPGNFSVMIFLLRPLTSFFVLQSLLPFLSVSDPVTESRRTRRRYWWRHWDACACRKDVSACRNPLKSSTAYRALLATISSNKSHKTTEGIFNLPGESTPNSPLPSIVWHRINFFAHVALSSSTVWSVECFRFLRWRVLAFSISGNYLGIT